MPTYRTGRKLWALAAAALAPLFPAPGCAAEPAAVESVVYQGAKHIKEAELIALSGVCKGEPVNPAKNKAACQKIVARLHADGRPFATCDLLAGGDVTETQVIFNITEGPKVRVQEVRFTGNTFLSDATLLCYVPGDDGPFSAIPADMNARLIEGIYRSFGFHDVSVSIERVWIPVGMGVILVYHVNEGARSRGASGPNSPR